eukprot:CAMPEP_0195281478 /NCGR_PEP_ID=MMETSP0707-20130614/767_1 /TAXON_ID=33640 /ORGANISM="Asterionellopsis glacialis, Strain CCMP134" /LENGTH=410 /DNA_ID=CAMNT_0040340363 /DNA_START=218 /DNA_END=1450 /DNA_ORIENTATION=+
MMPFRNRVASLIWLLGFFHVACAFSFVTPALNTRIVHPGLAISPAKNSNQLLRINARSINIIACDASIASDTIAAENDEQETSANVVETTEELTLEVTERSSAEKVLNAVLLMTCFGYAFFVIFNIDSGMTRGWTQSEIAYRIPLDNWNNYETSLSNHPIETKTLINVIIYLLGDWLSQTVFQKKNVLDFDALRTIRNGFIGLCFGPLVHMYYEWSDTILPPTDLVNRVQKIFMDQTLYLSIKCSMYITAVGLLGGDSIEDVTDNVKERLIPIMFTAWKFWPLVHCVTYGLIPARHRILWVNCVDLIWNAILASKASGDAPSEEDVAEAEAIVIIPAEDSVLAATAVLPGKNLSGSTTAPPFFAMYEEGFPAKVEDEENVAIKEEIVTILNDNTDKNFNISMTEPAPVSA